MKKIENGFLDIYYLTEEGQVYNTETNTYIEAGADYLFSLLTKDKKKKSISLKNLYRMVFNKNYCKDNIQDEAGEEWREIQGTQGNYFVSNHGRIKSKTKYIAQILAPYKNQCGYCRVDIYIDKVRHSFLVHKLVGMYFLPAPNSIAAQLHHKDSNIYNNRADNLEYLTPKEHKKKHIKKKKQKEGGEADV